MPIRNAIWTVGDRPTPLVEARLPSERVLEDMIIAAPRIVSDEWMLIGRQERTGTGGIIDLLAIIPGYLSILFVGSQSLLVLRALRLLRIFRIFKLTHFLSEMRFLGGAITGSLKKITIFLLVVFTTVIIMGSVMYLVERGQNEDFRSIPDSIYWAIVTITTVGYGDISPVTSVGKFVASIIMLTGYGIIAVPTGIITTEMTMAMRRKQEKHEVCPHCGKEGHDADAKFCKNCGGAI